jgi:hypothetical protein
MDSTVGSPWAADPVVPPPEPGGVGRQRGNHRDWLGRAGKRTVAGGGRTARRRGRRRPRAGLEAGGGGVGGARGEVGQFGEEDNRGLVGPTRDLLWPRWVGGSRVSAKERVLSR